MWVLTDRTIASQAMPVGDVNVSSFGPRERPTEVCLAETRKSHLLGMLSVAL